MPRSPFALWLLILVFTVTVVKGNTAVASTTSPRLSVVPSNLSLLRGGASFWGKLLFFGGPSPQKIYRQSLEEQVLLLDQQLRQAQEELIHLRDQRKEALKKQKLARFVTSTKADRKAQYKEQLLLQQKIDTILIQLKQMERMKLELEELLAASNLRIQELEAKLVEQEILTKELEENYQQQIAAIKQSLEETAAQQSAQFAAIQEERIRQAVEVARQEALLEVEERIQGITKDLQAKHDKAIQAERERSIKAVEAEKKKMRKLVKALAIREKKLLAKADKDRKNKNHQSTLSSDELGIDLDDDNEPALESTSSVEVSGSSSFQQRAKTTPTTRGFI